LIESLCCDITEFTGLYVRVPLSNHLFGIIEIPGSHRVAERADKYLAHSTSTTVRSKIIVFRMIDVDLSSLRESLEN